MRDALRDEHGAQRVIDSVRAIVTAPERLHSGSTRFELFAIDIFDLLDLADNALDLRRQLAEAQAWLERISIAAGADDATPAAILSALTE